MLPIEPDIPFDDPGQLAAFHKGMGHFEVWRKIVLATCRKAVRAEAEAAKAKMTGDMADDEAHTHPAYVDFCTRHLHGRIAYENMITEKMGV